MSGTRTSDPNIIELDDPGTLRQRLAGGVVILLFVAAMCLPFFYGGNSGAQVAEETPASHQDLVGLCAPWNVPGYLQPVADAAYPTWRWVCQLTQ